MPTIIHQSEVSMEWDDIRQWIEPVKHHDGDRSPGLHLSTILRYIAIQNRYLELGKVDPEDVDPDVMPLRMVLGMAWENYWAGFYPDMIWQPGELERGGVAGTPDGFTYGGDDIRGLVLDLGCSPLIVEECKLTWRSARRNPIDHWMYMEQLAGYINMLRGQGEIDACLGRMHVFHVNGYYEKHQVGTPVYVKTLVHFSGKELEGSWRMVEGYRDRVDWGNVDWETLGK